MWKETRVCCPYVGARKEKGGYVHHRDRGDGERGVEGGVRGADGDEEVVARGQGGEIGGCDAAGAVGAEGEHGGAVCDGFRIFVGGSVHARFRGFGG